ncbi:MAG: heterodisulfide reductase subunit C [Deltaproteobacteria bacterium RBG_13_43_22]|nr:MAG: heterodisulfide reductase subunit C [Deltaproteobacteria bacterium RBG_13_43_22]
MDQVVGPKYGSRGGAGKAYNQSFAREVYRNVDSGEEIKMCMQCGVCAASCPLKEKMDFSPRKIFTLIRAGQREKVLSSQAIMLCTSCYSCKVRCPRKVPVVDVMHGLAHYALRQGYKPRAETALFGQKFWGNIYRLGRIDEKDVALRYFLGHGLGQGIKLMMENKNMGIGMLWYKRMKILPERPIKNVKSLRKMLDKAKAMGKGGAV